jgi:hypothetical protein
MTILNPEHLGVRPWQQSENAKAPRNAKRSCCRQRRCVGTGLLIRFGLTPDVSARTRSWRFLAPWRFNFLACHHRRRLSRGHGRV